MAKISKEITSNIGSLSKPELEKLVLKAAAVSKLFHDYLLVNYFDKQFAEQDLFQQAKIDLDKLFRKQYRGFADQQQYAAMLVACSKRIDDFAKTCKQKQLVADLLFYVLELPFALGFSSFGTCFTVFDYRVALLLKKLTDLLAKELHEDYLLDYREKVNGWLAIIHQKSTHIKTVSSLPLSV